MAFDGTDNCWIPTWPIDVSREPRMNVSKFGDGYEQRALDGINWMSTTWNLKWPMRPSGVIVAMDAYLTAMQAGAFPFFDPLSNQTVQVFCDSWKVSWTYKGNKDDYGDLEAEFRIANGDGIVGALV